MIVRKPYAFLIKYFKIIHIILFILMFYLSFKTRNIYIFFKSYVKTGTYSYINNIVSKYINIPMIIISIILIVLLLAIFFLMKEKKKTIIYYLSSIIFYICSFISFLVLIKFYSNLEYQSFTNQTLVIYRDLTMVLYYLNYYFVIIAFIRGFGFNIKKFNFEKDIKELDITDKDREEIEIGSNIDYENVNNFFRKRKRHFKYYIKENSFILTIFLIIIILVTTSYITIDKFIINKTYLENNLITLNNVDYIVNWSYITNKDKLGNYIKDSNTYYLVINLNILNKQNSSFKLDIDNYRVKINNTYYYPKTNLNNKFNDLGNIYKNQSLLTNIDNNYIIIFEIENNYKKNITFELFYNKKVNNGLVNLYYKDIKLNPILESDIDLGTFKLNDKVSIDNVCFNTVFYLNNYEILDIINYTYTKCSSNIDDGMCNDYNASLVPSIGKKILKIEYSSSNNINIFNYLNISYLKDNITYNIDNSNISNITPDNYLDNYVLLEVDKNISMSDLIFNFDIRGIKFKIEG